ncbi:unnamed protein product [Sphenostylis stenocarpa]|uniref:Uncharacterized protein n=1 Tax=Sphenostylis stenocarpa TaxID=92480 RepID=A0AA86VE90_9FABA|nr:unnamed protein product [Sphenostylis stenocarpa]
MVFALRKLGMNLISLWLLTLMTLTAHSSLVKWVSPFVDLNDQVHFDTQLGMMGIEFHPNFANNDPFFASFNCDKDKWSGCNGVCSCNSNVDCDLSKLGNDNGVQSVMMGDGGGSGDPLRGASEINKLGLWSSYSSPKDNLFSEDKDLQPEIWDLGLRNPWQYTYKFQIWPFPDIFINIQYDELQGVQTWKGILCVLAVPFGIVQQLKSVTILEKISLS